MTPTRIERYSYEESGRSQFGNTKKPDCHEIVLCNENPLMQCKHLSTLRTSWKSDQSVFYRQQVIQICLKLSHQSQFRRFVGQTLITIISRIKRHRPLTSHIWNTLHSSLPLLPHSVRGGAMMWSVLWRCPGRAGRGVREGGSLDGRGGRGMTGIF